MTIPLRYGDTTHSFRADGALEGIVVEPEALSERLDPHGVIAAALAAPIGSATLQEIARGRRSASILVPGVDRKAGVLEFAAPLVAELNAAGIDDRSIEFVLAPGTHVNDGAADLARLLGPLASRVRGRVHDARAPQGLRTVGATSRGTPVAFDRGVLDAEVKVLTGGIVPHYFAGYSGGRKALLPGVAAFESILANHKLTLDAERGIHPRAAPCVLDGNPVHEDMLEAASLARPDFCFNTIVHPEHGIVAAVAGDPIAAHRAGCAIAEKAFARRLERRLDWVVTSAGGAPYDVNFVQGLKALLDVEAAVKDGGAVLWLARCERGMSPAFLRWAAFGDDAALDGAVRDNYDLGGHNSILLRRVLRRVSVALLSDLPAEDVARLGVHPVASFDVGVEWLAARASRTPGGARGAVVPFANVTCVSAP